MNYFQQLASGINVTPLMNAIQRQPELWDAHPIRTSHPGTAHAQVSDILLRFNDLDEYLCTGDPKVLTGRIAHTQTFLREVGWLT